jgi:4-hydroxybenzoyl-CoA thioesterase
MMQFETERLVEWGDCDEAGAVYYPHYFRWMDGIFHEICHRFGFDQRGLRSQFGVFATPSTYGNRLTICANFSRWGNTGFNVEYRFFNEDRLVVNGEKKRVFFTKGDNDRFRSTPIPRPFLDRLSHG